MYQKISDQEYHAINLPSQSRLKYLIDHNFATYLELCKEEFSSESQRIGSIAHAMNLENIKIEEFPIFQRLDGRTKEGKKLKEDLSALKTYIFQDEIMQLNIMNYNFKNSIEAKSILESATHIEQYGIIEIMNERYPENKIQFKFKPDIVGNDFVADYKTIGYHATEKEMAKAMKNYHYPFQAAAYLIFDSVLTGEMKNNFYWIFQETIAPYSVRVVTLDQDTLNIAKDKFDSALQKYINGINYPDKQKPNYSGITEMSLLYY